MSLLKGNSESLLTDSGTQDQSSTSHVKDRHREGSPPGHTGISNAAAAATEARQQQRIAQLEVLELGRTAKQKHINYYAAKGRAMRRVIALFDNIKDLVVENDRQYDVDKDASHTWDQDRLQVGYITLMHTLQWFHKKGLEMEYDEYAQMLKMLRQGSDGARGDDTSKLKALVSEWVNREFKPNPPVNPDDKNSHGFTNDACGRLLCPAELDWNDPIVKAGIRDRSDGYVVTDLSFLTFLYEKYTANAEDLEGGLFKGKILLQSYKAVFTSPSSAKDIEGDGDGGDIIQNNRRAKKACFGPSKVKKHVAQIIHLDKVTPRSIAYIVCQVLFALSSINSWHSVDGDLDYVQFW